MQFLTTSVNIFKINLGLSTVAVSILQKTKPVLDIGVDINNRSFITRNWLLWLWGLRSATVGRYELESELCNSVWVGRPENEEHQSCKFKSKGPRIGANSVIPDQRKGLRNRRATEDGCFSSSRWSKFVLPPHWSSLHALRRLDGAYPLVKETFFTQCTNSNASIFQRHLLRHTQKCLTNYLEIPLAQSGWHVQLTITITISSFSFRICK